MYDQVRRSGNAFQKDSLRHCDSIVSSDSQTDNTGQKAWEYLSERQSQMLYTTLDKAGL
jgi:hypothetical protein